MKLKIFITMELKNAKVDWVRVLTFVKYLITALIGFITGTQI